MERAEARSSSVALEASVIRRTVERSKRLRGAHVLLRVRLCRVGVAGARVSCGLLSADVEPSGFLLGELDDREPGLSLGSRVLKEQVDLLETSRTSFRVEEVDRRDDGKVDDGVGGVCLVHDVCEHDGAGDDDAEVGKPVHGG
jgi:hypothetical protein